MRIKLTLWPTLITVPMLAVMVGLGVWQLERLNWKTAQIDERRTRAAGPPIALPYDGRIAIEDVLYRPARVAGQYMHEAEMYLLNRVRDGKPGVHVITPLVRKDTGSVVLVDRGWAPYDWPTTRAGSIAADPAEVTVIGIVRPAERPGWLVPENRPQENQWYFMDLDAMARSAGALPFTDYYLFALAEAPAGQDSGAETGGPAWPIANEWRVDLPNDHLSYAITWFALAGVLCVVYLAYHVRRREG